MLRIIMDNAKEYMVEESISEICDILFDYNSAIKKEILKNDLVRISDRILINPSHVASIEEIEMVFNLSRNCFQEKAF